MKTPTLIVRLCGLYLLVTNGFGLVRAGLGATFITPSEAKQLPGDVRFCPLVGPAPESRLVLGWRDKSAIAPALAAFLDVACAREKTSPQP